MATQTKASAIKEGQEFSVNEDGHLYLAIDDAEVSEEYADIATATGDFCVNPNTIVWVQS